MMQKMLVAAGAVAMLLGTVAIAQTVDGPAADADVAGLGMAGEMFGEGQRGMARGMMGGFFGADFATLDTDGDGSITEADLEARAAERFARADADSSGGLTAAEMAAMAEIIRQEQMVARLAERIARIDVSGDGEVQIEELQARMPATVHLFDLLDGDNDGAISAEEFDAARVEMAEMRAEHGPGDGWGFWNRRGEHGPRHHN